MSEQPEEASSIESVPLIEREIDPIGAGTDSTGKKIAHWHQADRRARQTGPIVNSREAVVGRQKKEPCYEVTHFVKNPGGFKINEVLYRGRVVVPRCVADYLTYMDREWDKAERNLFRNNPLDRHLGTF
jgi:hypothetical protein